VDFGIAKTPINTRLTKMGETLGSPMFMSPEACRGEDVDHRADLYSFGVLLYLMLCGRVPFEDDNLLKVLQMQVSEPLPSPRSINPDVSPELAAVLERALAKDPAARYISMDALLIDLEAAVPPGSDRLLIEAHTGGASSFRIMTLTGQPSAQRVADSQRLSRVASQPLPSQVGNPPSVTTSSGTLSALPAHPRRSRTWWLVALPMIGVAAFGGWLAMHRDGAQPAVQGPTEAEPGAAIAPHEPGLAHDPPAMGTAAAATHDARIDTPAPPPAETVHLHVATTPGGATVELDGKRLGATPLDVELARRDREAHLVISHDGFTEVRQRLDLRGDQSLSLVLPPVAHLPRVIKRVAPPAPVRRETDLDIRLSR
jgi:eukaryotic-like serine/threonine-protein kinase